MSEREGDNAQTYIILEGSRVGACSSPFGGATPWRPVVSTPPASMHRGHAPGFPFRPGRRAADRRRTPPGSAEDLRQARAPRVGKGGGGVVLALVAHVERLDRAEPWSWLRERGLLAGGWPWWPGRPWRAPGASEAGGRHSRGTGLRPDPRGSLYGPHRV